jgi:hypothetical protein
MEHPVITLALIAWLAFSGVIQMLRGILGWSRTYDGWDAVGAPVEVGLAIAAVLVLAGAL